MNCVYVFGKKQIAENIKADTKIVIFGAGGNAQTGIRNLDIMDKIEFIVDNDSGKWNKFYNVNGKKWPIKSPEALINLNDTYVIFIISQYYVEIAEQLEKIGCLHDITCLIYITHKEAGLIQQTIAHYDELLQTVGPDKTNSMAAEKEKLLNAVIKGEKPFIMPRIVFQVTTKCTMRCKSCVTLAPHFKEHYEYNIETLKKDIDNIFRAVDYCGTMGLIGGETFLYPHLAEAIKYAADSEKIFCIGISTNGTIIPDETLMQALKNPKIYVEITDYGNIAKTSALVAALIKNNIIFRVKPCTLWTDYGDITQRARTEDQLNMHFKACRCGHYVKRMFNGRLWGCLRGCNLNLLGKLDFDHDSVLIKDTDTVKEIREKIEYLHELEYLEACNYCDGGVIPAKIMSWYDQNDPNGTKNSKHTIIPLDEYIALTKFREEHSLYSDN